MVYGSLGSQEASPRWSAKDPLQLWRQAAPERPIAFTKYLGINIVGIIYPLEFNVAIEHDH